MKVKKVKLLHDDIFEVVFEEVKEKRTEDSLISISRKIEHEEKQIAMHEKNLSRLRLIKEAISKKK